jgi:hypothetical protein
MLPHIIVKSIIHGAPWRSGYADRFFWDSPRLWQVAFSSEHGMFLWTPVLLFATAGLFLLLRRDRAMALALLASFTIFYYVVASYQNWHGQSSFGSRFFVSYVSAFVLGLAVFIDDALIGISRMAARIGRPLKSLRLLPHAVVAVLVAWNIGFIFQWGANVVPNRGPVQLSVVAANQFSVVPDRIGSFIWRYFTARSQLTSEIEQQDRAEQAGYQVQR